MLFDQQLNIHKIFEQLAKALSDQTACMHKLRFC